MKLAQLTLLGRNFNLNMGANLQVYALQHFLKRKGYDIELINSDLLFYPTKLLNKMEAFYLLFFHSMKTKGISHVFRRSIPWLITKLKEKTLQDQDEVNKKISVEEFKRKYVRFADEIRSVKDLKCKKYDVYIVASDLVWSPSSLDSKKLKYYLLAFIENGIKVSYAASIGEKIPEWACKIFRKYIPLFNAVSVREKTSAEALKKCVGIDAKVVLDPVLLLSKDDYLKISRKPHNFPKGKYILVYDIYNSQKIVPWTKSIAAKEGLTVVTYSKYGDYSFYPYGPQEFIWLVENSELVITSSFHGTTFAVLFRKPFYAVTSEPYAPASRIRDFLELVGAEDRFLDDLNSLPSSIDNDIDWGFIVQNLDAQREKSMEFLLSALEGKSR